MKSSSAQRAPASPRAPRRTRRRRCRRAQRATAPARVRPGCATRRARRGAGRTDPCRRWAPGRCRTCRRALRACRRAPPPARPRSSGSSLARDLRPVVLLDGGGDAAAAPRRARVIAPHEPLQLGKLADHVGDEIGLREQRGAIGEGGVGAHQRRDARRRARAGARRAPPACRACCDRRPRAACRQRARRAAACGPGRRRTWRRPGARAARARCRRRSAAGSGVCDVAHDEEAVDQPARVVGEREVALVQLHGEDQALLRHREERGVEGAGVHDRPLDQRGDLVEQRVGHDRASHRRRRLRGRRRCSRGARRSEGTTLPSASSVGS